MDKVRVGIVGSRFAAQLHCNSYSRIGGAQLVAIASLDDLAPIARQWRIPHTYAAYQEMLGRDDVDLVSVCVPNSLHHDVVVAASNAGKHVVCEKPLATTVEDARHMVEVCKKNGTLLMYAEDWCFCPALTRAREIVRQGALGRVLYVKAKETHNGTHSPFAKDRKTCGGGSFMHLGIHAITYLLQLLGDEGRNPVTEVTGKMTAGGEGNLVHKDNGGEDFGMGFLRFKNGEFGFVEGNYITVGGMDDKVEIYGSDGVVKADLTFGSPLSCYSRTGIDYAIEKTDFTTGWTRPAVDELHSLGYVSELSYFVDCVRTGTAPSYGINGETGRACVELVQAFYESNETGRTVHGEWK